MKAAKDKDGEICLFKDTPHFDCGNWHVLDDCSDNVNSRFSLKPFGIFGANNLGLFREDGVCDPVDVTIVSFESLVEKLCPPSHDGKTSGLYLEMMAAKMKYMEGHEFESYEEEKRWMADYLRTHWSGLQ